MKADYSTQSEIERVEPTWVTDKPENRAMDGQTVKMPSGVYKMRVLMKHPQTGKAKPGFIMIALEPHDEAAVCDYIRKLCPK